MLPLWKVIQSFFADLRRNGADAGAAPTIPVVALITGDQDRDLLKSIGSRDQLDIHFANTCSEAWVAANRLESPVVLCERDLPGMEWQDAVRILASAIPHPCVILTSKVVDDYLWREIVARGGYDVLASRCARMPPHAPSNSRCPIGKALHGAAPACRPSGNDIALFWICDV